MRSQLLSDAYYFVRQDITPPARYPRSEETTPKQRVPKGSDGGLSTSSAASTSSFVYPRIPRSDAPPSSFQGVPQALIPGGQSISLPSQPTILDRAQTTAFIPSMDSSISSLYTQSSALPTTTTTTPTTTIPTQASSLLLHPSSAAGSPALTAAAPIPPNALPKPSRRNTTGSTSSPTHNRSRSLNLPAGSSSSPPLPSEPTDQQADAFGGLAQSYSREGRRDDSLDSDILKEAEQIRRERNSKRARERAAAQAEAEAKLTTGHARHYRTGSREPTTDDERAHVAVAVGAVPTSREKPEEDKVLVGNLIGEDHVNYVLMYNMLTGIRIGVSSILLLIRGAF